MEATYKGFTIKPDGTVLGRRGKPLSQRDHTKGYKVVTLRLRDEGCQETHYVHRLVAKSFIPNPLGLPQVNHKDGDKSNNSAENLEWCTNQQNRDHAVANNLHAKGEKARAMLTDKQVKEIRSRYIPYKVTAKALAKEYKVSQQHVSDIINFKRRN